MGSVSLLQARQKDATSGEIRLGEEISKSLQKIINPYFLRRTKADVVKKSKMNQELNEEDKENSNPNKPKNGQKKSLE